MVLDRAALGLPPASAAVQGVYRLRAAQWLSQGTIVLQGTGVTNAFLTQTLPLLDREKLDLNIYVITSSELFDMLPPTTRKRIFPEAHQQEAMGITVPMIGSGMNAMRIRGPARNCVSAAPICAPMAAPVCITSAIRMSTLPFNACVTVP